MEKRTGQISIEEMGNAEVTMVRLLLEQMFPSNVDFIAGLRRVVTKILNR